MYADSRRCDQDAAIKALHSRRYIQGVATEVCAACVQPPPSVLYKVT